MVIIIIGMKDIRWLGRGLGMRLARRRRVEAITCFVIVMIIMTIMTTMVVMTIMIVDMCVSMSGGGEASLAADLSS